MALIDIKNLTFGYDGSYDNIFDNASFQLDTDWRLGFVGRNGRGKTTFLNLLMGKYEYKGSISSPVAFDYFPFQVSDKERLAIDALMEIDPGLELWQVQRELNLLDLPEELLYSRYATLSGGEQAKVQLAALFSRENHFLLIDEPTNHLDMKGRETVAAYLKGKKGFILVSHDRTFLDSCIDHVLSINRSSIEVQRGNFTSWQENKALQDQYEQDENQRLKKDIKRLEQAARRTASWSDEIEKSKIGTHAADRGFIGHKSAKMMKRSKATEARQDKAAEEKSRLLKNIESAESLKLHPLEYHAQTLLEITDLALSYGEKQVCRGFSMTLKKGERIALAGRNGSGKSSILRLICGADISHTGQIRVGSGLKISYVSQDTSFLQGGLREYADDCGIDESLFKAILRKLDFQRVQFEKDMADFSEGQKKKVLIARSLCEGAHLYIWDEPLNFIDVLSRIQIEELLLSAQPTMLFVEHDRQFADRVATRIVTIE